MSSPSKLNGAVAIVTGAGRGIGKAISCALAAAGTHVVLAARTSRQIDELAAQIIADGGAATAIRADVSNEQDILSLFQTLTSKLGRVDVLINNAGIGVFGPTADFKSDPFDAMYETNVRGTFLCCREALKLMLPAKRGYLINISSVVGFKGYPKQAAYTATKHAVMGLTKALAAEVAGTGIRVSAILPGGVDTDMVGDARPDLNRAELMSPEDVAQSVMYLLSLSDRAAVDQIYIRRRNSAAF
jgi:NAD(P)-dependent dehydrogenase (short-subunit alcohol dehydrogenase family)